MKICAVSDTHLTTDLSNLPEADMLIHCGDALNCGYSIEVSSLKEHFEKISERYKYILFTPGNHDTCFEEDFDLARKELEQVINLIVLHDKAVTIEGLKFYGTSWQPFFCSWAFNVGKKVGFQNWTDSEKLAEYYANIPDDTDVLITHCPPYGIRDSVGDIEKSGRRCGSPELLNRVADLKNLKAHFFGHIHYSHGIEERNEIKFINAATCNEDYDPVNPPIVIDL